MHKGLLVPFAVGIVAIAAAVVGILYMQRGAHVELKGSILKVRTQALDENSAAVIVDFRFANPSDYKFVVRKVEVLLDDPSGKRVEGMAVADSDAARIFQYYPLLGPKYNDSLKARDVVRPRESQDRMIAARFELPQGVVNARKKLVVRVEDVDGPVTELVQ